MTILCNFLDADTGDEMGEAELLMVPRVGDALCLQFDAPTGPMNGYRVERVTWCVRDFPAGDHVKEAFVEQVATLALRDLREEKES